MVILKTFLLIGLSLLLSCGSEIQVSQFTEDQSVLDVRVEQLSTQADPTKSANIYFNVYFSNPIESKTFGADDIIQDGTSSGIIWDVIHVSEGKHFIVIGTGPMTNGTFILNSTDTPYIRLWRC